MAFEIPIYMSAMKALFYKTPFPSFFSLAFCLPGGSELFILHYFQGVLATLLPCISSQLGKTKSGVVLFLQVSS